MRNTIILALLVLATACGADSSTPVAVTGDIAAANQPPTCRLIDAHDDMTMDDTDHDDMTMDDDMTEDDGDIDMIIEIDMSEFAYDCVLPDIETGTVAKLVFHNVGSEQHEAVIGDESVQAQAAAEMAAMADMADMAEGHAHAHGDVAAITAQPGETKELVVTFGEPSDVIIGCHFAGHWESGMHTTFTVVDA